MNDITPLISVAPMMNYTDRHARFLFRLISPHVRLYTEMITTQAILNNDPHRFLNFHPSEKYLALQLGGNNPQELAQCAKIGEEFGYDEINLNVGCPSSRVKSGQFGVCLMLNSHLVADCVAMMHNKVSIPITVKCRIGVDQQDSYEFLYHFINIVSQNGCDLFIIHARKALLLGLNPKQNRTVPPIRYDLVQQIKKDFPKLTIFINGGIKTIADISYHFQYVDGVMIGREAYSNPYLLAEFEAKFFHLQKILSRTEIVQNYLPYVYEQLRNNVKLSTLVRPLFGLFQTRPGAALWRRYLSEHAYQKNASSEIIKQALAIM